MRCTFPYSLPNVAYSGSDSFDITAPRARWTTSEHQPGGATMRHSVTWPTGCGKRLERWYERVKPT